MAMIIPDHGNLTEYTIHNTLTDNFTIEDEGKPNATLWIVSSNVDAQDNNNATIWKLSKDLELIDIISSVVTIVLILVTFLVYVFVKTLRCAGSYCIANLTICLALAQTAMLLGFSDTDEKLKCKIIGGVTEFFWVAAFFWINVNSVDFLWSLMYFVSRVKRTRHCVVYTLYCYGMATLFIICVFLYDNIDIDATISPRIGDTVCFISSPSSLLLFFTTPCAGLAIISLLIMFFSVAKRYKLCSGFLSGRKKRGEARGLERDEKLICIQNSSISLVMMANMLCKSGLVVMYSDVFAVISMATNVALGVTIILVCVCRKDVIRKIKMHTKFIRHQKEMNKHAQENRKQREIVKIQEMEEPIKLKAVLDADTYRKHHKFYQLIQRDESSGQLQSSMSSMTADNRPPTRNVSQFDMSQSRMSNSISVLSPDDIISYDVQQGKCLRAPRRRESCNKNSNLLQHGSGSSESDLNNILLSIRQRNERQQSIVDADNTSQRTYAASEGLMSGGHDIAVFGEGLMSGGHDIDVFSTRGSNYHQGQYESAKSSIAQETCTLNGSQLSVYPETYFSHQKQSKDRSQYGSDADVLTPEKGTKARSIPPFGHRLLRGSCIPKTLLQQEVRQKPGFRSKHALERN